jgi:periplasmic protein TonB
MYGVMRERARNRPMQIAGLAVSAAATVAAANLLMSGFGNFVDAFTPESTTLATIAPEKEATPPPDFNTPEDEVKLSSTVLTQVDEKFVHDEEKKEDKITAAEGDEVERVGKPGAAAVVPPKAVRVAPKLRSQEKPPYPGTEIRLRNEGNTSLGLCVDARGRVTSASLVKSSGHPRLDEAALKWVKDARFSPGTVDGAAQTVCGHTVVYEWRLEDAR